LQLIVSVGCWNEDRQFWKDDPTHYAGARDLCQKIRNHLVKLRTVRLPHNTLKKIEPKLPDSKSTLAKQNKETAIFDAAMVT